MGCIVNRADWEFLVKHELGVQNESQRRTAWHRRYPVYELIPEPTEREMLIAERLKGVYICIRQ